MELENTIRELESCNATLKTRVIELEMENTQQAQELSCKHDREVALNVEHMKKVEELERRNLELLRGGKYTIIFYHL